MSRIKVTENEKVHIRKLQESDNLSDWGTQIWGTSPNDPKLQEQITITCKPCAAGTRFPAVMNPTCGKRVKCIGRVCKDGDYFGGCCDDAAIDTYKKFNGGGQAKCSCYLPVEMSFCK